MTTRRRNAPVEYKQLGWAIRWEALRFEYFSQYGMADRAQMSAIRREEYEKRSVYEAEAQGVPAEGLPAEAVFQ